MIPSNMPARRARRRARAIARQLGLPQTDLKIDMKFRVKRHGGYQPIMNRLADGLPEVYRPPVCGWPWQRNESASSKESTT